MKRAIHVGLWLLTSVGPVLGQGRQDAGNPQPAKTIGAATANHQKFEGFFDFYYDNSSGKILLEVDRFDEEFLYFSAIAAGAGSAAEKGRATSYIVKFVKVGPKVFLLRPEYNYRAVNGNEDEVKSVETAFAKSIIWAFNPVAAEGGRVLVDLTPFLIRDSQGIAGSLAGGGSRGGAAGGGNAYRVDDSRSAIFMENTKNFPKNSEFEAVVTFAGGASGGGGGFGRGGGIAPDPAAVTLHLHQSFVALPEPGFNMRKFDARSGFNAFTYMDFSAPMEEPLTKRFIRRHRLQKKDPQAAISEPVEPIVYYVDRGAPELIKKALIEGGAWWNEAFEAAGFRNAFIVKELPADADPMDIRYNVVNWINRSGSPRAFSYGSSYTDPRTGEIIKGVVTLGADRHRQDYLIAEGLLQPYETGKPASKQMEEMALARIRQLSAHEIGHTLGFMHNFAASPKGRASVMDYPFPRIDLDKDGTLSLDSAYGVGIGSWDIRAVIWGYAEFPPGADEDAELEKIMQETLAQGHQYIPDIGGYTHPVSHQWDDGVDPIEQLQHLMKVRRLVLDRFSERAIRDGEPMTTIHEVLVPAYLLHRYQIEAVAKSVGGLYFTHAIKGDGQEPTRMVEPDRQWKAFDALMTTITPEALALPETLIQKIPPRPSGYPRSIELFSGNTGPTFDPLAAAASAATETVASLLNAERAARLVEYKARDSKQPGLMAVLDRLLAETWGKPLATGYAGALQTTVNHLVLTHLLKLAADKEASGIVRGQALLKINDLKTRLQADLNSANDEQKAQALFAVSQIEKFEKDPDEFQPGRTFEMPPGAPIMPGMDFLRHSHTENCGHFITN
ncbi:zinc-dependent metalloprotease [Parapedobacter sp. ISTM3]|uniref:Peptidase n=1 Tax=Parapedobacter luteus TaxID=623280 RepID=A0A1T5BVG0_9SPHI|nr:MULTISPECIES: zinc-dependent metalloprotease [Parapedobacter]MBK1442333.1 zinc-dependent metalloprotease [Parapedobacter sp. ISTM3]SKB51318.1 protein of unknown function [Parapedobacter luteus]